LSEITTEPPQYTTHVPKPPASNFGNRYQPDINAISQRLLISPATVRDTMTDY
jgi:hypothetical protein